MFVHSEHILGVLVKASPSVLSPHRLHPDCIQTVCITAHKPNNNLFTFQMTEDSRKRASSDEGRPGGHKRARKQTRQEPKSKPDSDPSNELAGSKRKSPEPYTPSETHTDPKLDPLTVYDENKAEIELWYDHDYSGKMGVHPNHRDLKSGHPWFVKVEAWMKRNRTWQPLTKKPKLTNKTPSPVRLPKPHQISYPDDLERVPEYPDTIEDYDVWENGRYKCGHSNREPPLICCTEGLSRDKKKNAIRKSVISWKIKVERLADKKRLDERHKTWANWQDPKLRQKYQPELHKANMEKKQRNARLEREAKQQAKECKAKGGRREGGKESRETRSGVGEDEDETDEEDGNEGEVVEQMKTGVMGGVRLPITTPSALTLPPSVSRPTQPHNHSSQPLPPTLALPSQHPYTHPSNALVPPSRQLSTLSSPSDPPNHPDPAQNTAPYALFLWAFSDVDTALDQILSSHSQTLPDPDSPANVTSTPTTPAITMPATITIEDPDPAPHLPPSPSPSSSPLLISEVLYLTSLPETFATRSVTVDREIEVMLGWAYGDAQIDIDEEENEDVANLSELLVKEGKSEWQRYCDFMDDAGTDEESPEYDMF